MYQITTITQQSLIEKKYYLVLKHNDEEVRKVRMVFAVLSFDESFDTEEEALNIFEELTQDNIDKGFWA